MDKLDWLFDMQEKFQKSLGYEDYFNAGKDKQEWTNVVLLACIDELMEMLRETPWKPWKKQQSYNKGKVHDELVDLLHFFINLCLLAGLDSQLLFEKYLHKHKINYKRQDDGY